MKKSPETLSAHEREAGYSPGPTLSRGNPSPCPSSWAMPPRFQELNLVTVDSTRGSLPVENKRFVLLC